MQESNQRRWHRGGADREAYRGCFCMLPLFPRLRAALPYVPLPARVGSWSIVELIQDRQQQKPTQPGIEENRLTQIHRRRPGRGLGGGRLKVGLLMEIYLRSNDRLCGQRLPPAAFFGSFLVRTQEMNTRQVFEQDRAAPGPCSLIRTKSKSLRSSHWVLCRLCLFFSP